MAQFVQRLGKVSKNEEFANLCYCLPSSQGVFEVHEREFTYIVDITARECTCRKWNLTGIPCQHDISCLRHERIPPESVVHDCYSIASFNKAYETNILPCNDKSLWVKVGGPEVLPPVYDKKVGRPPKSRKKQPHEVQGKFGPRLSKHGVSVTCSYCKVEGHNVRGCFLKKNELRPEDYVPNPIHVDDDDDENQPGMGEEQPAVGEQQPADAQHVAGGDDHYGQVLGILSMVGTQTSAH